METKDDQNAAKPVAEKKIVLDIRAAKGVACLVALTSFLVGMSWGGGVVALVDKTAFGFVLSAFALVTALTIGKLGWAVAKDTLSQKEPQPPESKPTGKAASSSLGACVPGGRGGISG